MESPTIDTTTRCRECHCDAEIKVTDGQIDLIRCLQCGIEVSGERAASLLQRQFSYACIQAFIQSPNYVPIRTFLLPDGTQIRIDALPPIEEPEWGFYTVLNNDS